MEIRYWRQRNDLFRLYDEDIYMTDDAWFGVTAEPIAEYVTHSALFRLLTLDPTHANTTSAKSPPSSPPRTPSSPTPRAS